MIESSSAVYSSPFMASTSLMVEDASPLHVTSSRGAASSDRLVVCVLTGAVALIRERHLCNAVFYSYCPEPRNEFVFDPVMRTCVNARDHEIELCNQSPNRFHTRADCHSSCVRTERPSANCFDRPAFAKCQRQDFKYSPWIFDGYACRPWHFPMGKCPHNGHIFGDRSECSSRCLNGSLATSSACFTPGAQACLLKEFRFLYFAVPAAGGSKRLLCLRASVIRTLRCSSSTNGFGTAESCELACSGGREDDDE
ncbi:hypothetical protein MRX96_017534 [Rhipicephalus microplus]